MTDDRVAHHQAQQAQADSVERLHMRESNSTRQRTVDECELPQREKKGHDDQTTADLTDGQLVDSWPRCSLAPLIPRPYAALIRACGINLQRTNV